jgi:hypothetical protein
MGIIHQMVVARHSVTTVATARVRPLRSPFTGGSLRAEPSALRCAHVQIGYSGTATLSADYTSQTAIIPAGQASTTVTLTPIVDASSEGPETIIATVLASPEYVVGTPSSATAVLIDASAVPALSPLGLIAAALLLALAGLFVLRGGTIGH